MYSYCEKSKVKVLSPPSSFRNGIWLQTGLWRSMTEVLTSQLCNIRYQVPTFPISDHKQQNKRHSNNMCSMWPRVFVFVAFWNPCFSDGLLSLCLGLLDDAETVVQEREQPTNFSSLFLPKLQTITITTNVVDRPSLSSWCCTLICSVLGRRKPNLFSCGKKTT